MNLGDWLVHFFGLDGTGLGYAFWSGIGSDLGEITLIGGAIAIYRHHTCHLDGCWRLGRHKHVVDGQEYVLCRKHHPTVPDRITADTIKGTR